MNKKMRKRMRELDRKIGVSIGTHERIFGEQIVLPENIRNDIIQEFKNYQESKNA